MPAQNILPCQAITINDLLDPTAEDNHLKLAAALIKRQIDEVVLGCNGPDVTARSVGLALDELRSNFEQKIRAQLDAAVDRVMESVDELEWQAPVHSISYDLEEFPTKILLKTTFELK